MRSPSTSQPENHVKIDIKVTATSAVVLEGLKIWFERELIVDVDLSWREERSRDRRLQVWARREPELLQGLADWEQLGLLSDAQIRRLCSHEFVCLTPEFSTVHTATAIAQATTPIAGSLSESWQQQPSSQLPSVAPKIPKPPSAGAQMVRSLMAEFSLVWLLFLGVFLVVVSSGLLAASQWANFSAQGQYLVLLGYTLAFFGVGFWTSKQESLRLTSRTLQLVTLLIIPANFWAMDRLHLLDDSLGLLLSAIAGFLLSGVTIFLLQPSFVIRDGQKIGHKPSAIFAVLLLSWLHFGWGWQFFPIAAVYLGIGSVALVNLFAPKRRLSNADLSTFPVSEIATNYGTLLLLVRALFFGDVYFTQLGLAFGLCGWLLCRFSDQAQGRSPVLTSEQSAAPSEAAPPAIKSSQLSFNSGAGQLLLAIGWLCGVWATPPWQALAVSGLVLWLLGDRLRQFERPRDLTYIFIWGLQILWLGDRVFPSEWRSQSLALMFKLFQTTSEISLAGVGLFAYVVLTLGASVCFRWQNKQALAKRAEVLALGFGVLLSALSFPIATTRFANLSLSAIALFVVQTIRSPTSKILPSLVYTSHALGLVAIASGVYVFLPTLDLYGWTGLILVMMLAEWGFTLSQGVQQGAQVGTSDPSQSSKSRRMTLWRESAWIFGVGLAALSYTALGTTAIAPDRLPQFGYWSVIWLLVPAAFTFLGTRQTFSERATAISLSIVGLLFGQFLTWQTDGSRLIGLGIALMLMLLNTRQNRALFPAFLATGLGITFISISLWQFQTSSGLLSQLTFAINGAVVCVTLLFVLSHWLKHRRDRNVSNLNLPLNQAYAHAFDLWSVILSTSVLLIQSFLAVIVFSDFQILDFGQDLFIRLLMGTLVVTGGLVYRTWQEPVAWTEWGIAWGMELLVSGAITLTNGSMIELAIANLALGLLTQFLGDWWLQRTGRTEYPLSWHIIPLIYGVMGALFRIGNFSDLSGLFTLSTALVGIGVGRRASEFNPIFKAISYLSIAIATFSAYELLFYQLLAQSTEGGSLGDGVVILAVLGLVISLIYKLFANGIMPYLKLSIAEIEISAHLHWLASVLFLCGGAFVQPSAFGGMIGSVVAIALTGYALLEGRNISQFADGWVYSGIATGIGATGYLLFFAFPDAGLMTNVLQPYAAAISCAIAYTFFTLPFEHWGWSNRPWHNAAWGLPVIFVLLTANAIAIPCLLIVSTFYGIFAKLRGQIRLSYISVWLIDWAFFRVFAQQSIATLFPVLILGISALYIVQVEPLLRSPSAKDTRHVLRTLVMVGICGTAFVESFRDPMIALTAWAIATIFIVIGLAVRVRAYLYVGTGLFILLVLTQVLFLMRQYSFVMWAIGIFAGITFILVAANFEARREKILALLRNVAIELEAWD